MTDLDLMSDAQTVVMFALGVALWLGLAVRHVHRRRVARRRRSTWHTTTPRHVRVNIMQ